jgi:putative PIN family toxin of toxin-antitoxin system
MAFSRPVVLDTNIIVSAFLSSLGKPNRILIMALNGDIQIVLCDEVEAEYRDVLTRPHFKFDSNRVNLVLDQLLSIGMSVDVFKSTIPFDDEDDRIFYDLAKSTGAILVTGNIRHYPTDDAVMPPAEFLRRL